MWKKSREEGGPEEGARRTRRARSKDVKRGLRRKMEDDAGALR